MSSVLSYDDLTDTSEHPFADNGGALCWRVDKDQHTYLCTVVPWSTTRRVRRGMQPVLHRGPDVYETVNMHKVWVLVPKGHPLSARFFGGSGKSESQRTATRLRVQRTLERYVGTEVHALEHAAHARSLLVLVNVGDDVLAAVLAANDLVDMLAKHRNRRRG